MKILKDEAVEEFFQNEDGDTLIFRDNQRLPDAYVLEKWKQSCFTSQTVLGTLEFEPFVCEAILGVLEKQDEGMSCHDMGLPLRAVHEGNFVFLIQDGYNGSVVYVYEPDDEYDEEEMMELIIENHFSWLNRSRKVLSEVEWKQLQ